ncbi:ADP-ribosylation factor-like protein 6-interacting protein 4 [Nematostella vectensis]|uniref:ADP-ribosylation factor-like protein 6-interacting protein 4 n=1 Tax=Nematostella vectensis TaxID=45351 RepID=UPI0020773CE8|nr:ADP-ribosylation factor-like protein 6-interacting protein 4 [Nematostella vectensis]
MSSRQSSQSRGRSTEKNKKRRYSESSSDSFSSSSSEDRRRAKKKKLSKHRKNNKGLELQPIKKVKKRKETKKSRKYSTTDCDSSSDDGENSDSSRERSIKKHKKKKKRKKKIKKNRKKTMENESKNEKNKRGPVKNNEDDLKPGTNLSPKQPSDKPENKSGASYDMGLEHKTVKRSMVPMTKEEYEKQQNVIRRVYDEETGRHRLIKGDGEILEEIVSYDRHKAINKKATQGDGTFFASKLGIDKYW